jgi:hypothetical protein
MRADERQTCEDVVWFEISRLPSCAVSHTGPGTELSVQLSIPDDVPATGLVPENVAPLTGHRHAQRKADLFDVSKISWCLQIKVPTGGIDYRECFLPIPVGQSEPSVREGVTEEPRQAAIARERKEHTERLAKLRDRHAGLSYDEYSRIQAMTLWWKQ